MTEIKLGRTPHSAFRNSQFAIRNSHFSWLFSGVHFGMDDKNRLVARRPDGRDEQFRVASVRQSPSNTRALSAAGASNLRALSVGVRQPSNST
jgi:hypothetical protein